MQSRIGISTKLLIDRHGKTYTYQSIQEGVYDVNTSSNVITKTNYSVTAYATQLSYSEKQSPNLVVEKSSVMLIAGQGLSFTPKVGDLIVEGTETYTVIFVSKTLYQGGVALWRLGVEKS